MIPVPRGTKYLGAPCRRCGNCVRHRSNRMCVECNAKQPDTRWRRLPPHPLKFVHQLHPPGSANDNAKAVAA